MQGIANVNPFTPDYDSGGGGQKVKAKSGIIPIQYLASNPSGIYLYPTSLKKHHPTLLQDDDLINKSD